MLCENGARRPRRGCRAPRRARRSLEELPGRELIRITEGLPSSESSQSQSPFHRFVSSGCKKPPRRCFPCGGSSSVTAGPKICVFFLSGSLVVDTPNVETYHAFLNSWGVQTNRGTEKKSHGGDSTRFSPPLIGHPGEHPRSRRTDRDVHLRRFRILCFDSETQISMYASVVAS